MALHLRLMLALLLLVTLAPATPAPAAQTATVPGLPATLPTGPGFDAPVYTAAEFGEHIYLGGEFTYATPTSGGLHAYNPATGALRDDPTLPRVDGRVVATVGDGAGGSFIGGTFLQVNGMERRHLAHIRADGSLNTAWQPQLPNLGFRGQITALAFDGVNLYSAIRRFTKRSNESWAELQAHNATSGDLVWSLAFDNVITSLALADATLYVGGYFRVINGAPDYYGLAAIQPVSGAVQAWVPQILLDGRSPLIETLVVDGSTLYIGGLFTQIEGANRRNLAAFDRANGTLTDWAPQLDRGVASLQIIEQQLWAYGSFTAIAGEPRNNLAVFTLPTLSLTSVTLPAAVVGSVPDKGIVVDAETITVLVTDTSVSALGARVYHPLTIDRATGATRNGPRLTATLNVLALLTGSAGQVLISNPDVGVGGGPRSGLARIDPVTGVLDDWQAPEQVQVIARAFAGPDRLYLIGTFSDLQPSRFFLRSLDPVTNTFGSWSTQIVDTYTDLILVGEELIYLGVAPGGEPTNSVFGLVATNIHTGATRLFGQAEIVGISGNPGIDKLLAHNGTLYVGGQFEAYGLPGDGEEDELLPMPKRLAAFDLATGTLLDWQPVFGDPATNSSSGLYSMVIHENTLYVSGRFDIVNGQPRNGIIAFSLEDRSLLPWQPEPVTFSWSIVSAGNSLYTAVFSDQKSRIIAIAPATGITNNEWQVTLSSPNEIYGLLAVSTGLLVYGRYESIAGSVQRNSAFFPFTQTSPEPTATPTATPEASATPTATPSPTPEASATPTATPSPTPTNEPAPNGAAFQVFLPVLVGN